MLCFIAFCALFVIGPIYLFNKIFFLLKIKNGSYLKGSALLVWALSSSFLALRFRKRNSTKRGVLSKK